MNGPPRWKKPAMWVRPISTRCWPLMPRKNRLGVRGMHSHLQALDIPLSFLSVREVGLEAVQAMGAVLDHDPAAAIPGQPVYPWPLDLA